MESAKIMDRDFVSTRIKAAERANNSAKAAESLWGIARFLYRNERTAEAAFVAKKAERIHAKVGAKMRADRKLKELVW